MLEERKSKWQIFIFLATLMGCSASLASGIWEINFFGQQQTGGTFISNPRAHCASQLDGKFLGYLDSQGHYTNDPSKIRGGRCEYRDPGYFIPFYVGYAKQFDCLPDLETGICVAQSNNGAPPDQAKMCSRMPSGMPPVMVGNPVNLTTGNKFQREVDYASHELMFSRFYNSSDGRWRHSYSARLLVSSWFMTLVRSDGRETYFRVNNGVVESPKEELGFVSKLDNGWVYYDPIGIRYYFNQYGTLVRKETYGGYEALIRESGLTTVANEKGNSLFFAENDLGQPTRVGTDDVEILYSYNADNQLSGVTTLRGSHSSSVSYFYEDDRNPKLLTGITDERGVRYATWSYDELGRALSSEHADGADRVEVSYNDDSSSTVTNELGKKTTYRFQTIQGIKRITAIEGEPSPNCPSSNSTFTYDDRGLLKTKTDNKGIVTTYVYNDRGLEITRTEASGSVQARTVTTEWHPSLYLPLAVTESDRITRYQYDDQGRQLSQTVENR